MEELPRDLERLPPAHNPVYIHSLIRQHPSLVYTVNKGNQTYAAQFYSHGSKIKLCSQSLTFRLHVLLQFYFPRIPCKKQKLQHVQIVWYFLQQISLQPHALLSILGLNRAQSAPHLDLLVLTRLFCYFNINLHETFRMSGEDFSALVSERPTTGVTVIFVIVSCIELCENSLTHKQQREL